MKKDNEQSKSTLFDGVLLKPVSKEKLYYELSKYLSFKIKKLKPGSTQKTFNLDNETIEKNVVETLEATYVERWKKVRATNRIKDNKTFGEDLVEYGKCKKSLIIENYGSEIVAAADCFDIERLTSQLEWFPELIEQLKTKHKI